MTEEFQERMKRSQMGTYNPGTCPSCGSTLNFKWVPAGNAGDYDPHQWVVPGKTRCFNPSCDRYDDGTHL